MFPKTYFAAAFFSGYFFPPVEGGPTPPETAVQLDIKLRSFTERGRF
jgi:hypothetical protein